MKKQIKNKEKKDCFLHYKTSTQVFFWLCSEYFFCTSGGHNICLTGGFSLPVIYQVMNHIMRWKKKQADGFCDWGDPTITLTLRFPLTVHTISSFSAPCWPHTNKKLSCPSTTWILYLWQLASRVNKKLISNDKISNSVKNR